MTRGEAWLDPRLRPHVGALVETDGLAREGVTRRVDERGKSPSVSLRPRTMSMTSQQEGSEISHGAGFRKLRAVAAAADTVGVGAGAH